MFRDKDLDVNSKVQAVETNFKEIKWAFNLGSTKEGGSRGTSKGEETQLVGEALSETGKVSGGEVSQ